MGFAKVVDVRALRAGARVRSFFVWASACDLWRKALAWRVCLCVLAVDQGEVRSLVYGFMFGK
jgi:hypothetical protein